MTRVWVALLLAVFARAQDEGAGRRIFESRCAGCHGVDASGGERGPRINARSPETLRQIIRNGVPGAGMPAFALTDAEMSSVLAFLEPRISAPAGGDVKAGQAYFFGKGGCARCHMVEGRGGVIGPELTRVGRGRIDRALRGPIEPGPGYRTVIVRLRDGRELRGVVRNESNFDLQLMALDGTLHLFEKREVSGIRREAGSLMPPISAAADERRDLIAFLTADVRPDLPPLPPVSGSPTFDEIAHPRQGEWPGYNGVPGGNRHSPLKEITPANVARLAPKWIFSVPDARRLEVTPVVVDGVMYITAANEAFALDARTGRQIWHFQRPLTKGMSGDAAGGINRGVAVLGNRVFLVTDHAHLLALHRSNGALVWDVPIADYRQNYGTTSAPLVVNDLVLVGTSGGDEGARGLIAAFRASDGALAWTHWTMPAPGEPGSETWKGRAIEHGCAAPWLTGSYDPEVKLVYWTTGNPCPDYNGDERLGDNLYTSSVLALDPATGVRRWHFQFTPHDLHDWDAAQPVLAVNAVFAGRERKLLLQANRNGFFYVLDRVTGEFLMGKQFAKKVTWASGIGPDGRPILVAGNDPSPEGTKSCPAVEGAANWMSSAYSTATRLFYVQTLERCSIYSKSDAWWEPGKSFYGGGTKRVPGEQPEKILRAIDIRTGNVVWEIPQIGPATSWGGVLSTDSGLLFFGEDSGAFAAADAKTGKVLWSFQTSQVWKASPMTYEVGGWQFVAVASGGNIVTFGLP